MRPVTSHDDQYGVLRKQNRYIRDGDSQVGRLQLCRRTEVADSVYHVPLRDGYSYVTVTVM
jgi:hypothetical protein